MIICLTLVSFFQFYYGEDGLDIQKTGFLDVKQLPFLIENHKIMSNKDTVKTANHRLGKKVSKLEKKVTEVILD